MYDGEVKISIALSILLFLAVLRHENNRRINMRNER